MYKKTKLHSGNLEDCLVCTLPADRRKRKFEKKVKRAKSDLYSTLKNLVAEEAGEEATPVELFALNQKYGVNEAKVEQVSEEESRRKQRWLGQQFINESRRVKKPSFMEETQWKELQKEWISVTKPLITAEQYKKPMPNRVRPATRPLNQWKPRTSAPRDSGRYETNTSPYDTSRLNIADISKT